MVETIDVRHSTLTSAANVIGGSPKSPVEVDSDAAQDLRSLFNRADTAIDREAGGFFLDSIDDVLVFGYLTPRIGDDVRGKEYFYDVFECPLAVVDGIDVVKLRNQFESRRVERTDAEFKPELAFDRTELAVGPETTTDSWRTVARVWDQFRRDDSSAAAHFEDLAAFAAHVDGAFRAFSYVEPSQSVTSSGFDFHRDSPPEFDPERQGFLLTFVENLAAETEGRPHVDQLPDLATERRRRLESEIDDRLDDLQTRADYRETIRQRWIAHFDEYVADIIDDHIETYVELQRTKLHPGEEFETLDEGLLDGLLTSEPTDKLEARLDRETEDTVDQIRAEASRLADDIEKTIRKRQQQMLKESEVQVRKLESSELYEQVSDE